LLEYKCKEEFFTDIKSFNAYITLIFTVKNHFQHWEELIGEEVPPLLLGGINMNLIYALILSILVEALISYAKDIYQNRKLCWEYLLSIAIGLGLAFAYQIDLVALALGIDSQIPYMGIIITGIVISRGSNYVFDLWNHILEVKQPSFDDIKK